MLVPMERGFVEEIEFAIYQKAASTQSGESWKSAVTAESERVLAEMKRLSDSLRPIPPHSSYSLRLFYSKQCPETLAPPDSFRVATASDQLMVDRTEFVKDIDIYTLCDTAAILVRISLPKTGGVGTELNEFSVKFKSTTNRMRTSNAAPRTQREPDRNETAKQTVSAKIIQFGPSL